MSPHTIHRAERPSGILFERLVAVRYKSLTTNEFLFEWKTSLGTSRSHI